MGCKRLPIGSISVRRDDRASLDFQNPNGQEARERYDRHLQAEQAWEEDVRLPAMPAAGRRSIVMIIMIVLLMIFFFFFFYILSLVVCLYIFYVVCVVVVFVVLEVSRFRWVFRKSKPRAPQCSWTLTQEISPKPPKP